MKADFIHLHCGMFQYVERQLIPLSCQVLVYLFQTLYIGEFFKVLNVAKDDVNRRVLFIPAVK